MNHLIITLELSQQYCGERDLKKPLCVITFPRKRLYEKQMCIVVAISFSFFTVHSRHRHINRSHIKNNDESFQVKITHAAFLDLI
jgi:hypothetical protein